MKKLRVDMHRLMQELDMVCWNLQLGERSPEDRAHYLQEAEIHGECVLECLGRGLPHRWIPSNGNSLQAAYLDQLIDALTFVWSENKSPDIEEVQRVRNALKEAEVGYRIREETAPPPTSDHGANFEWVILRGHRFGGLEGKQREIMRHLYDIRPKLSKTRELRAAGVLWADTPVRDIFRGDFSELYKLIQKEKGKDGYHWPT